MDKLGHIILIQNQPVFTLKPKCCALSEETANINFIVFDLTQPRFKPVIYCTRGKHTDHYINDVIRVKLKEIIHAHVY